jgi:hypothetical protein
MARKGEVSILLRVRDAGSAVIANVQARFQRFAAQVRGYMLSVNGALAALGLGLTATGLVAFIVRATTEFQRFAAQLRVFTGDASKAQGVMDDLRKLAM